jgi:hypothetical protein
MFYAFLLALSHRSIIGKMRQMQQPRRTHAQFSLEMRHSLVFSYIECRLCGLIALGPTPPQSPLDLFWPSR